MMGNYAGIDWSGDRHDVFVCDAAGDPVVASTFSHDEPGIRSLCSTLVRLGVELVGIDRPDGLLVEPLLDAGPRVLPLHSQPSGGRAFAVQGLGAPSQIASTRSSSVS